MWDEMVDIHGKLHGKDVNMNYIDEGAWEVDSDAYSQRSVSDSDDINMNYIDEEAFKVDDGAYSNLSVSDTDDTSSFINDNTTDYESTEDSNSEDDF